MDRATQLQERDFPLIEARPRAKHVDRAYAYRVASRGRVEEKFTTNFEAACRQVAALRAQGCVVLTYSIFV